MAKVTAGIMLSVTLSIVLTAQNAQALYQRGLVEKHSNNNLNEAIKLYSQAAKTVGKDRAFVAKALV